LVVWWKFAALYFPSGLRDFFPGIHHKGSGSYNGFIVGLASCQLRAAHAHGHLSCSGWVLHHACYSYLKV